MDKALKKWIKDWIMFRLGGNLVDEPEPTQSEGTTASVAQGGKKDGMLM